MERDAHETLLNELLNPELETSRKTEILQTLRVDYNATLGSLDELSQTKEKLSKDNQDLIISNSKLFRQLGVVSAPEDEKLQEKSKSETITLDDLERG